MFDFWKSIKTLTMYTLTEMNIHYYVQHNCYISNEQKIKEILILSESEISF